VNDSSSRRIQPHAIAGIIGGVLIAVAVYLVASNWTAVRALGEPPPTDFAVTVSPAELLTPLPTQTAAAQAGLPATAVVVLPPLDAATAPAELPAATRAPVEPDPALSRAGPRPLAPTHLLIPSINLDVPITTSVWVALPELQAGYFDAPPSRAAGWQPNTARLGEPGNLVLSGHNNILGRVFENLKDVKPGDLVILRGGGREIVYKITERRLLLEKDQSIEVRTQNAQYILPGGEDRVTLITCWPPDNNTHRIVVIARPVAENKDAQR